jgi:Flp pilus assembly protein TadG
MSHTIANTQPVRRSQARDRRGVIIVLTALLLVFLLGMIAFAVDLGFIANTRTELQSAVDSAAYAGAGALVSGTGAATTAAQSYYTQNKAGGGSLTAATLGLEFGNWSTTARTFTVTNTQPNAIRASASITNKPLFFGNVFGRSGFDMSAKAVATYMPRDIVIVLDFSRSMCFDSSFDNIGVLSQSTIEANMRQIWADLGSPTYGTLTLTPSQYGNSSTKNSSVMSKFGLNKVAYPYPSGSWSEYVDFVQTDSTVSAAGYANKYGGLTLIQYWQTWQARASQTPTLYATNQQPVTSVKDAVDVFLSYLTANSTDDRVGLAIYTASDNTAILEQSLTNTFTNVSTKVRARQAGHYVGGTNISAGMTTGRLELVNNARVGAKKMMILMTDGEANMPTGNSTTDKALCITEANLAAAANIPIVTITVGADADTALMQSIADVTGGAYFQIPGGQSTAAVKSQLEAVFGQVAADRPLKLVQ